MSSISTIPAMTSGSDELNEKPTMQPTPSMTTSASALVAMSAKVRPASTAERAIGSERNRSIRPLLRSSASPSAVTKPPNAIVWTMIPGIRKSA